MLLKQKGSEKMNYLYGPVPSRRLGVSLGIDLIPHKICSFNCIYCECGPTTKLTIKRDEFKPVNLVIEELNNYLKDKPKLDYITFSGSGEPTLYKKIGTIIDFLQKDYPDYQIALLTNSSLLHKKKVRNQIKKVDLISPSLDSVIKRNFETINRPHSKIKLSQIIEGLIELRKEFDGKIFLEIFIVPNINDSKEELYKFHDIIKEIKPDLVQLNTLDRPGAEDWCTPASKSSLEDTVNIIGKEAEIIGPYLPKKRNTIQPTLKESIISTLKRRPCTVKDLSNIFDLHVNEINRYLRQLEKNYNIKGKEGKRGKFYYLTKEEK